jgi:myo-inositol 2-dehydrogenase / D-chiro-inositol 1-dehydrogenase
MRLNGGTVVVMTAARHDPLGYDVRAELFGSSDSVVVGVGPRTPLRSLEPGIPPPEGPAWSSFLDRFESAYAAELATFVDVARGLAASPCTARDGIEALRIADAATTSMRQRRVVRISEVG